MMLTEAVYQKIFSQVDQQTVILTPNRRLSATLHQYFVRYQISRQQHFWQTPSILPILSWLESLWQQYIDIASEPLPLLLNATCEQLLWKDIITHTKKYEHLLKVSETADLIQSAYKLITEWRCEINQPIFDSTDDYQMLQRLVRQYLNVCDKNHWIDMSRLPDELLKKEILLPKNIILFGFSELSPQLQQFFAHYQSVGSNIININSIDIKSQTKRFALKDQEDEIYHMANWAKTIYQANLQNSELTIGIVIPNLDKIRNRVAQIFSEVFMNFELASQTETIDNHSLPYNISAGKKLTQYPIIAAVFQILSFNPKYISQDLIWFLLSSPFIGDAESEKHERARIDFILRDANIGDIDTSNAYQMSPLSKYCPKLTKRIQLTCDFIATTLHQPNITKLYSEWAHYFNDMLTIMGWPGERSLNSEEYQTADRWLTLLNQLMLLDQVAAPVNVMQALQSLQNLANKLIFQPKTNQASIQILGILEAAALPFDYLWLSGVDDTTWPPKPKPNPFIPRKLQRELQMPHSTAERELNYCQQLIEQFKKSAKTLICSYPRKNKENELQASPLILDIPEEESSNDYPASLLSNRLFQAKNLETFVDEMGPQVAHNEKIRGGVHVLKYQSLCPFRAFSECRLQAKDLPTRQFGMRAKDRGNIIHKVLEILWNQLKDQQSLMNMREDELNFLVTNCISETFTLLAINHHYKSRYLQLEKKRLHKLITQWLMIEKQRAPFKVIATEKTTQLLIDQLTLSIKVDRVDELLNKQQLIIDYKTGKNNEISSWFGERPDEIQLPLYALMNSSIAGITYVQIVPGNSKFKGVCDQMLDIDINGIKQISAIKQSTADWKSQLLQWQETFQQLANDFHMGIAKVNPKDGEKTCTFCALKSLCRFREGDHAMQY